MPPGPSLLSLSLLSLLLPLVQLLLLLAVIRGGRRGAGWCCDAATPPCHGCGFYCRRRRRGCWCWWAMGERRRARSVVVVDVDVVIDNNDCSMSEFYCTISANRVDSIS